MLPPSRLCPSSEECLVRLKAHVAEAVDLSSHKSNKLAAVLVLLFERDGQLRVLLTTRAKTLRTHPGQTALPGGKADETDENFVATAFREAYEEVQLPIESPSIEVLCQLQPFVSGYGLVVTPVIAYLSDPSLLDCLKASPDEVDHIFSHPLEALLDPPTIFAPVEDTLVPLESSNWPFRERFNTINDTPVPFLPGAIYRNLRFRSEASPVKGFTADVLLSVAEIAYGRNAIFERYAPGQLVDFKKINARMIELEQQKA